MAELLPPAKLDQTVGGQQGGTGNEDHDLDGVVVGHGAHAAESGVKAGEHDDENGADPETVDRGSRDIQAHLRKQRGEDHSAGENADGDLGDDEGDQGDDGENVAGFHAKAALEELRHGEDHRAHVKRHKDPRQNQKAPGVQFVVGHGHAAGGTGTREADDVFRSDIRSENGSADDPPAEIAASEEIVSSRILCLANDPPGDTQQDAEVKSDHQPVESGEVRPTDR